MHVTVILLVEDLAVDSVERLVLLHVCGKSFPEKDQWARLFEVRISHTNGRQNTCSKYDAAVVSFNNPFFTPSNKRLKIIIFASVANFI